MIFFVPCHDPATEANLAVAERIYGENCRSLFRDRANRDELLAALAREDLPLFAMAHGRHSELLAQEKRKGFSEQDVNALRGRPVFAFACHTASALGREASRSGSVWWGYTGPIHSPDSSASFLPMFVEVFSRIRDSFAQARSVEDCGVILLLIGDLYEEALSKIEDLMRSDPDLDPSEANYCLTHVWQRLRVWWPGLDSPLKHPAAPDPLLFP